MTTNQILNTLSPIRNQDKESVVIIGVDNSKKFLFYKELTTKSTNMDAYIKPSSIVDECKKHNCTKVYIAHNHPKTHILDSVLIEDVSPSDEDLRFTDTERTILEARGITLLDHYIVSSNMYLSIFNYLKNKEVPPAQYSCITTNFENTAHKGTITLKRRA